jgi:hypothetical protein
VVVQYRTCHISWMLPCIPHTFFCTPCCRHISCLFLMHSCSCSQGRLMKSWDMIPSISFQFRSPWKISQRLENLWYDIDIHSHVSPCLFCNSFSIAWARLFHHLLIPKQNHTVLVSWLFFFPLLSLIVGSICWLSRILLELGKCPVPVQLFAMP